MTDNLPVKSVDKAPIIPLDLNQGEVIYHKRCKVCNSPYRNEAEVMFDKCRKIRRVHNMLKERDEDISYSSVHNHMNFHYIANSNNTLIQEYAGEVCKWVDADISHHRALERNIAILEREMVTLAAANESMDGEERRKNADVIKKLADSAHAFRKTLMELQEKEGTITFIFNQLNVILKDEIENANDPVAKTVIMKLVNRFKEDMGDITVE